MAERIPTPMQIYPMSAPLYPYTLSPQATFGQNAKVSKT